MSSMKTKTINLCVADTDASAVVEVDQAGKLHFSYTGFHYITKTLFRPYRIITYSQCQVLTYDFTTYRSRSLRKLGSKYLKKTGPCLRHYRNRETYLHIKCNVVWNPTI